MKARTSNSFVGMERLLSNRHQWMSLVSNLLNLADKVMSIIFSHSDAMDFYILIKNQIK